MASFEIHIPRPISPSTVGELHRALLARGLRCDVGGVELAPTLEFSGASDVVYLSVADGRIRHVAHNPDFGRALHAEITGCLDALAYEYLDEDDPRWPAAED